MIISIGNLPLKNIDADIFLHPITYKNSITYEPMAEEAVIGLMAKYFCYDKVNSNIKKYFDEMDDGYLFSESNFDEFDLQKLKVGKIIVGRDVLLHPKYENINKFLNILKEFGNFKIDNLEKSNFELEEIEELDSFDGKVVYCCDDKNIVKENELLTSKQFLMANRINSKIVKIDNQDKDIKEINELKGTFGIIYKQVEKYPFLKKV